MKIQIDEISFHYEIFGQGKPLVILHGLAGNTSTMTTVFEPIFEGNSKIQRIYVDLPGMGESRAPLEFAYSERILSALTDFIQQVVNQPFLLAGYSYGGYLARALSMSSVLDTLGLFLLAPMVLPDHTARHLPQAKWFEETSLFENSLKEYDKCYKPVDKAFLSQLEAHYSLDWEILKAHEYKNPTLILLGKQDNIVGFEDQLILLRDYPRATFAILDFAGHNLQNEQREILATLFENWLERCENDKEK